MKGKVIIITGGSNGIGFAMARKFVAEGAKVVITGRNAERLEKAKEKIDAETENLFTIQMDVRQMEEVNRMVEETVGKFGTIDFLINNAAGNFICPTEDLSPNGWRTVIDIVLNGTFYCTSSVGRYWIDNNIKGSITNMIATYAWDAAPNVIHSASAKAGVLAMTRTLAVEWGRKYGIRVNAIAPGPIERTGGAAKLFQTEEAEKRTMEHVPLGRLGTPEEIAELAHFLFMDQAQYINGECISMDGGSHLRQYSF